MDYPLLSMILTRSRCVPSHRYAHSMSMPGVKGVCLYSCPSRVHLSLAHSIIWTFPASFFMPSRACMKTPPLQLVTLSQRSCTLLRSRCVSYLARPFLIYRIYRPSSTSLPTTNRLACKPPTPYGLTKSKKCQIVNLTPVEPVELCGDRVWQGWSGGGRRHRRQGRGC
jgi:hypothetical protein